MKCPICDSPLTMNEHFEESRLCDTNKRIMGAPLGRVVFFESADSHDFLRHEFDCPKGHTIYISDDGLGENFLPPPTG